MVIAGTRSKPDDGENAVLVSFPSRFATVLSLSANTWFKVKGGVAVVKADKLTLRVPEKCPPGLLLQLDKLCGT